MAKIVKLDPIDQETSINTNDNLLSGLLNNEINVLPQCGGRGRCATCHIYIKDGMKSLSPLNRQEQRNDRHLHRTWPQTTGLTTRTVPPQARHTPSLQARRQAVSSHQSCLTLEKGTRTSCRSGHPGRIAREELYPGSRPDSPGRYCDGG